MIGQTFITSWWLRSRAKLGASVVAEIPRHHGQVGASRFMTALTIAVHIARDRVSANCGNCSCNIPLA